MDRQPTLLAPLDERQRYTLQEAVAYLRVSRARVYQKIAAGELAAFKDGKRVFISGAEIARLSRPPAPRAEACGPS